MGDLAILKILLTGEKHVLEGKVMPVLIVLQGQLPRFAYLIYIRSSKNGMLSLL